jgi:hypothetical protein
VAFWPLIATAAGAAAGDGTPVELAVDAAGIGVVAGMAALGWFRVERIVWPNPMPNIPISTCA